MQTAEPGSAEATVAAKSALLGRDNSTERVEPEAFSGTKAWVTSKSRQLSARSPGMTALVWFGLTILIGGAPSAALPTPGFDTSWQAGIGFAASQNFHFGDDIVFNYGPWGFLDWPQHVGRSQAVLGFLFSTAAVVATFCLTYRCVRLRWSARVAGPAAFAVTIASGPAGPGGRLVYAGLLVALLTLHKRSVRKTCDWRDTLPTALLVAVGTLLLQVKFSEGVALLALAGLVALSVASLRALVASIGVFLATFVLTFLTIWLAAQQRINDIVPWVRGSQEISSGYQEALSVESGEYLVGYIVAGILALAIGFLALRTALRHKTVAAVGVVAVAAVMLEFGFKHGFTRHDPPHEISFFVIAGFIFVGLVVWSRRPEIMLASAAVAFVMVPSSFANYDPFLARNQWRTGAELLMNDNYRRTSVEASKDRARERYQLPESVVGELRNHPVHVDPSELTLPWAYSLDWHPVPVFQSFSAYTPYLDELNAKALVEAPADQIVLQEATTGIDNRNIRWDTPRYVLALACNYRVGTRADRWSVLHHNQNRCSVPQTILTQPVQAGAPVAAPEVGPDEMLVVRYTPQPSSLAASLVHTVLKDWSPIQVATDDGTFRLPEALADGPLLVSFPAQLAWQEPFGAFHYRQLTFNRAGTVEFQVIKVQ
ncbi:hypothetical protein [Micromonospora inositola]|uniref:4-amino-4-deoxy-L-arabinose transferase n=1 Tax=Micromonospora inositola TaxID=47865 RepID=A0A1C5GYS9_9ACTN|nr:hypothetical protein [Micromonospora inositola]SCG38843.1 hypothetical protein GA0070613_0577 [Micromonospora inositola]